MRSTHPTTTRLVQHVRAARSSVYRAILDAQAVSTWMVPSGMTSQVHEFEPREGGVFRISLTYEAPGQQGKTSAHTDTYHGRFVRLVPDREVMQMMEFETDDVSMQGEMTVRFSLSDADGGTDVLAVHENVPPGVSPTDNEIGWRMSLEKLAAYAESPTRL